MDLLDYLATEFATFDDKPFNPVDSAALSQFCMVRAEGIVPPLRETDSSAAPRLRRTFSALRKRQLIQKLSDLVQDRSPSLRGGVRFVDFLRAERYEDMFTGLIPGRVKENLVALAASPRFRDMAMRDYASLFDAERQTQFAAMSFVREKDFAYIGFRGTDTSAIYRIISKSEELPQFEEALFF